MKLTGPVTFSVNIGFARRRQSFSVCRDEVNTTLVLTSRLWAVNCEIGPMYGFDWSQNYLGRDLSTDSICNVFWWKLCVSFIAPANLGWWRCCATLGPNLLLSGSKVFFIQARYENYAKNETYLVTMSNGKVIGSFLYVTLATVLFRKFCAEVCFFVYRPLKNPSGFTTFAFYRDITWYGKFLRW